MVSMKKVKIVDIPEGTMFCVPLVDGAGFGFGYVALARKGWGYLLNIFDHVSASDAPPADIENKALAVDNLLGNDALFTEARYNPDPWRLMDRKVAKIAPPTGTLFQIGGKALDMRDGQEVHDPSIDVSSLPLKKYPLDNKYSFLVTAALLKCDFRFNKEKASYELVR